MQLRVFIRVWPYVGAAQQFGSSAKPCILKSFLCLFRVKKGENLAVQHLGSEAEPFFFLPPTNEGFVYACEVLFETLGRGFFLRKKNL